MFQGRIDAGKKLAEALSKYKDKNVIVYALPRGGVVLGVEIAHALNAPLDLVIPRKIGHPHNSEYAVCAVSESGKLICNEEERRALDPKWLQDEVKKETQEAKRRRNTYFRHRKSKILVNGLIEGKTAIIVDDGVATGFTIRAAILDIRAKKPLKLIVAVPVLPKDVAEILRHEADELIAIEIPKFYAGAVGAYYNEFPQVEDEEVIEILNNSKMNI